MINLPLYFKNIAEKPSTLIVGLMSGTSMDGLDVVLVEFFNQSQPLGFKQHQFTIVDFPARVKQIQYDMVSSASVSWKTLCQFNHQLSEFYSDAILQCLSDWQVSPQQVDAIASHGQTVFHYPQSQRFDGQPMPTTLQLGDGDRIAAKTGILTVCDFRSKDIAFGGEGAPLVPYADYILFGQSERPRSMHNLGGISNITWLPGQGVQRGMVAFDTGPANVLIDIAVRRYFPTAPGYDPEGSLARQGKPNQALVGEWLKHPYFEKKPPKSTGREEFGDAWFESMLQDPVAQKLNKHDLLATLTEFTVQTIVKAYRDFFAFGGQFEIFLAGGGAHNRLIVEGMKKNLPELFIQGADQLGINPDARESISFALFANELLHGRPVTIPGLTGCPVRTTLGKLCLP